MTQNVPAGRGAVAADPALARRPPAGRNYVPPCSAGHRRRHWRDFRRGGGPVPGQLHRNRAGDRDLASAPAW